MIISKDATTHDDHNTFPEHAQSKLHNQEQNATSWRQPQDFGYETLVQRRDTLLPCNCKDGRVRPVVFCYHAGYFFRALNARFHDLNTKLIWKKQRTRGYRGTDVESDKCLYLVRNDRLITRIVDLRGIKECSSKSTNGTRHEVVEELALLGLMGNA